MLIKSCRKFLFSLSLTLLFLMAGANFCFGEPTADELLKLKGFVWKSASTEHFQMHFEPGSFAEIRIEDLKRVFGKDVAAVEKEWHGKLLEADAANIKYSF